MKVWQKVGYTYFETSALSTRSVQLNKSPHRVAREILAQDYAEGGFRFQDPIVFSRALLVRQVRRLFDPSPHPYRNLAHYWLNKTYGHLNMGNQLLLSNCDFLNLTAEMPAYWKNVFTCYGAMRGLEPDSDQNAHAAKRRKVEDEVMKQKEEDDMWMRQQLAVAKGRH